MWSQGGGAQGDCPWLYAREQLIAPCTRLGKAFSHFLWCTRGMTGILLSNFLGKGKWQPSERSQGTGKAFFPPSSLKGWLLYLPKQKRKIKSSLQTHPPPAVGRAADTIICTCKKRAQGLRGEGVGLAEQGQLSDIHPNGHLSEESIVIKLSSRLGCGGQSALGPWRLAPLCTLQLAPLSVAIPDQSLIGLPPFIQDLSSR